jgi:NADPH:quinone reductase-like Zn-dependent oxidoreductase
LIGEFKKGQSVLWHAGASGVSIAGVQLSRQAGASAIYTTAGSKEKCDFTVNELGATKAFNYKEQDWEQEIQKATEGEGVNVIIDMVGGDYLQKDLGAVSKDGRIVCLSTMGGSHANLTNMGLIVYKRISIVGSTLRSRDEEYQGKLRDKLEEYLKHFETGELQVKIDQVFDWKDIVKAHKAMESNSTSGKLICLVK